MEKVPPDEVGSPGAGIYPDDSQKNDHSAERQAENHQLMHAVFANAGQNVGQLKSDEDEHESIEDKRQRVPHSAPRQPRAAGIVERAFVAKIKAAGDGGEYA